MRTFSRMRLNGDGQIMPKEHGVLVRQSTTNMSYELSRLNSPIYRTAAESWVKVGEYEKGTEMVKGKKIKKKKSTSAHIESSSSVVVSEDECIRALYCALVTDETAVKFNVPKDSPFFSSGYPRVMTALRKAIEEQHSCPQLAAYALYSLTICAQLDPSLGNPIEMATRILNNPEICSYISKPAALVFRSCARKLRFPSHRSSQEEAHRGTYDLELLQRELVFNK